MIVKAIEDESIKEATAFIRQYVLGFDISRLGKLELKITYGRQYYSGMCKYPPKKTRNKPYHIVCRVSNLNPIRLPVTIHENIGTRTYDLHDPQGNVSGQGWSYVTKEMTFYNQNEVMVFVFGHEFWHFLCKTKQRRGNWETKANLFAIDLLDEYRDWRSYQVPEGGLKSAAGIQV